MLVLSLFRVVFIFSIVCSWHFVHRTALDTQNVRLGCLGQIFHDVRKMYMELYAGYVHGRLSGMMSKVKEYN